MDLQDVIDADIANVFIHNDDFAKGFTFSRTALSVAAIFDNDFVHIVDDVESLAPAITVNDTDIPGIKHGDTFTRDANSVVYNVIGIQPDGTGVTVVILSRT